MDLQFSETKNSSPTELELHECVSSETKCMAKQDFEHRISQIPNVRGDCASPCDIMHLADDSDKTENVCPKSISFPDDRPQEISPECILSTESSNGVDTPYGSGLERLFTTLISQLESEAQKLRADLRVEKALRLERDNELGERQNELSALKHSMAQEVTRHESDIHMLLARKVSQSEVLVQLCKLQLPSA
jgi:hypothetical protein